MCRYIWADHKNAENKDVSQEPMKKDDDFPTLFKYLMNYLPTGDASPPVVYHRERAQQDYKIAHKKVNYNGR